MSKEIAGIIAAVAGATVLWNMLDEDIKDNVTTNFAKSTQEEYKCECCLKATNDWHVGEGRFSKKYILCKYCSIKECQNSSFNCAWDDGRTL
jgi:hypothetical protein